MPIEFHDGLDYEKLIDQVQKESDQQFLVIVDDGLIDQNRLLDNIFTRLDIDISYEAGGHANHTSLSLFHLVTQIICAFRFIS